VSEDDKATQQALRRQFARQQAKELTEHTKQLHAKDVELEALRQQVSKVSSILMLIHYIVRNVISPCLTLT